MFDMIIVFFMICLGGGRSGNRVDEFESVVWYIIEIGRRKLKGELLPPILFHFILLP